MENRNRKTILRRLLVAVIAFSMIFSVMSSPNTSYAAGGKVKSITVTNLPAKQLTLKKGKKFKLKTKVSVSGTISKKVAYKTSNKKIATVSSGGTIAAKKNGKVTITIYSKADKKVKCKIKVTVGNPVTKVTLNKTKVTVTRGKTFKLKATVSPTKASCKSVIWKSSNTSVATVSSKGIVTAKKAGTAKVTAVAKDGSGKKKNCVVTVKNPLTIQSVAIEHGHLLKLTLSEATKLTTGDFAIAAKVSSTGNYIRTCPVSAISTKDNRTYLLYINEMDEGVMPYTYARVQIKKYNLSKEIFYKRAAANITDERIYSIRTGSELSDMSWTWVRFDTYGYSDITVTNLPAGVSYNVDNMYNRAEVTFTGKATVPGNVTTTIKCKDEYGNAYTYLQKWLIYDETHICAAVNESNCYKIVGNAGTSVKVSAYGGSGKYTYKLINTDSHFRVTTNYGNLDMTDYIPGDYKITVEVSDSENPDLKTTTSFVWHIKEGVKLSGVFTDAKGNKITDDRVSLVVTNVNEGDRYTQYSSTSTYEGEYSFHLNPGVYDIVVSCNGVTKKYFSYKLTEPVTTLNFQFPI